MPLLENARYEKFAQLLAAGTRQSDAYVAAGFLAKTPGAAQASASRLAAKPIIADRVVELQKVGAEAAGVEATKVMTELARIAFADIRRVVEWDGAADEGESNQVRLIDSKKLTPDEAAAVAEISQTPTGGLRIKMHNKLPALEALAKALGIYREGDSNAPADLVPLPERIAEYRRAEAIEASAGKVVELKKAQG